MTDEDAMRAAASAASTKPLTVYCGFDPTAPSLHLGNLLGIVVLAWFQKCGHNVVALCGGATARVGDPSGKSAERPVLSEEALATNVDGITDTLGSLLRRAGGEENVKVLDNMSWYGSMSLLEFLREVGKNARVGVMMAKDSVKTRLEGEGMSYTEFTYQLLQGYDFYMLRREHGVTVQIGGSDQWGNITGGIDLTRRMHQRQVFGVTTPLVTKADGTKFVKTEKGTIWISAKKTSPYALYQFWLNVSDLDVYKYLRYFTFLSAKQIREIELADKSSESKPEAQGILACEVTKLLHGAEGLTAATRISDGLFSGDISTLTRGDLEQIDLYGMPKTSFVEERVDIVQALVRSELAKSNKMAREFIGNNAISLNGSSIGSTDLILDSNNALDGGYFVLRRGKKMFHLVKLK